MKPGRQPLRPCRRPSTTEVHEPSAAAAELTTAVVPRLTVFGARTGRVIFHGTVVAVKATYVRRFLMSGASDRFRRTARGASRRLRPGG